MEISKVATGRLQLFQTKKSSLRSPHFPASRYGSVSGTKGEEGEKLFFFFFKRLTFRELYGKRFSEKA